MPSMLESAHLLACSPCMQNRWQAHPSFEIVDKFLSLQSHAEFYQSASHVAKGALRPLNVLARFLVILNPLAAFTLPRPGFRFLPGKVRSVSLRASAVEEKRRSSQHSPGLKGTVPLTADSVLAFERRGHVTIQRVIPAARIHSVLPDLEAVYEASLIEVYRQKLRVIIGEKELAALEARATRGPRGASTLFSLLSRRVKQLPAGSVPFLQAFNLWRKSPAIAALVSSPELAGVASQLLGADRVRLYQDSLFVKRPGDGDTHWHSDLAMTPLDTNAFVTLWLPLQPIPLESEGGSGLVFASGSHRDVALHFWHGDPLKHTDCSGRDYAESTLDATGLEVGDSTWHHGWTLHCAPPNSLKTTRRALAVSYFADGAKRLISPRRKSHSEDAESYADWLPEVSPGKPARHALLPLVWDTARGGSVPIITRKGQPESVAAAAQQIYQRCKGKRKSTSTSKFKLKVKITRKPAQRSK